MIYLTSFREARALPSTALVMSAARWAPDFARRWPRAEWAAPVRADGTAIKLRDFGENPLPKYREFMLELYRERWPSIREWVADLPPGPTYLCCWCPYTRTAERQIREFGTFHCHLGVVAEVLTAAGVAVKFGPQHERSLVR